MSIAEDQTRALNLQVIESRKNAAVEHMLALNRERLISETCRDPRVITFKERRTAIAMQPRMWKPSVDQALPKKRFK
jgi:hypothetical protein